MYLTSFAKELVRSGFKAFYWGVVIFLVLIGLFLFSEILASGLFIGFESSEGYSLGAINGQVGWTGIGPASTVAEDRQYAGAWSFKLLVGGGANHGIKSFGEIDSGQIEFYYWTSSAVATPYWQVRNQAGQELFLASLIGGAPSIIAWNETVIEWENSENTETRQWRYSLGAFTSEWFEFDTENAGPVDTIKFNVAGGAGNYNWYDDLDYGTVGCGEGHCELCETYPTCNEAGCEWYYSIFLQDWYCVEAEEPGVGVCGPFYKCIYCLTEVLCEAEMNCAWTDIGFGEHCYMIEPTIPPTQGDWEVPDIEDCGELAGVELWLCEIKNFIAGIFMPSQATIDELYLTIGAFKDKFPFNYGQSLMRFFTDVNEEFDEEKSIPITILGEEGNVSFEFWNETTTIGGEEEGLKDVLFDMTSFIVFIGWFVWIISLIRRFLK